jgi:hypothetical protein
MDVFLSPFIPYHPHPQDVVTSLLINNGVSENN